MYTSTWNKYLPVIRILLKRAILEEQTLQLNSSDFQKSATVRKTGHKFTIGFSNGKISNSIGLPEIARNLADVLLFDPAAKELLIQNGYTIRFDAKCQLILSSVAVLSPEVVAPAVEAVSE